jgi:Na+-translocating ferredoxin:NAD+ oxidoreductase subunit E
MNKVKIIINGIIKENPTFALILGMCPTLATTTSALNGMSMGLCTMFVLMCSNMAISAIKNVVPDQVRIPCFIVVIATLVSILQLIIKAYLPSLDTSLGIYIPLIVVNCIILGRAESFASKHNVVDSLCDGIGIGMGFTLALTLLGGLREILGAGSIFGVKLFSGDGMLLFILPPGAFIVLGYLIALVNHLRDKKKA